MDALARAVQRCGAAHQEMMAGRLDLLFDNHVGVQAVRPVPGASRVSLCPLPEDRASSGGAHVNRNVGL